MNSVKKKKEPLNFYNKDFKPYTKEKTSAYYNISFYNHLETLNSDRYICHIIFTKLFKLTHYQTIIRIEDEAIKELLAELKPVGNKQIYVSLIVEFLEGTKLTPDVGMIQEVLQYKDKVEDSKPVMLQHSIAILAEKFKKAYILFNFMSRYFNNKDEIRTVTDTYQSAIELIDKFELEKK